jgi:hypothetical protein
VRRELAAVLWMLPVLAFLALGTVWLRDRTRSREVPRWEATLFVSIVAESLAAEAPVCLVAVHPHCPHCVAALKRLTERARLEPGLPAGRIVALVVDTPARPAPSLASTLGVSDLRWDRAGIWRNRWGRRVYGEVLLFDARGRYLRSMHLVAAELAGHTAAMAADRVKERR